MTGRDTSWRQGSVMTIEGATAEGLYDKKDAASKKVLVVTHDCDLANEKEEFVELIIANVIDKLDMQFARARNVRRLHIAFMGLQNEKKILDLCIAHKQQVPKAVLNSTEPDTSWLLSEEEKRGLKQWLAARYGRPAFPNTFESYLRKKNGKGSTVESQLAKVLEKHSSNLIGVFFDLGENRTCELANNIPYDLRIIVVYNASEGGVAARQDMETCITKIREIFTTSYGNPESATEIALESCEAIADIKFSISDLRRVDQWRAEYISLRNVPMESFLSADKLV